MKILLVNNFYYNRGGDCTYLFSLKGLLEENGHKVSIFSMQHSRNLDCEYSRYFVSFIDYKEEVGDINISSGFRVLKRAIYSQEARKKIEVLLDEERPDIAHLQNIHHHITPSIFFALKKRNIPIVWTLHDYTVLCPNTHFLSHGMICERCKKRKYFWAPLTRCKKNSFSASLMAAIETTMHRIMKIHDMVDFFIAPSEFLRDKLIEYGFDKDKIIRLSNFLDVDPANEKEELKKDVKDYYLYIGRLSEEKGIKTLIDAAVKVNSCKLKIVGDGPLKEEMESYARSKANNNNKIEFLGHKPHEDVLKLISNCRFAVLPSECYENFPYSVAEAFADGKPIVGTRMGGIPELIKNWETGLLFEPGNSEELSLKIKFFVNHPDKAEKMGKVAKMYADKELTAEKHYVKLMETYKQAIFKHNQPGMSGFKGFKPVP